MFNVIQIFAMLYFEEVPGKYKCSYFFVKQDSKVFDAVV